MTGPFPEVQPSSAAFGIEMPRTGDSIYDECIAIAGWLALPETARNASPRVRAFLDGICIGQTEVLFARTEPDSPSNAAKQDVRHYRLLGRFPGGVAAAREGLIELVARLDERSEEFKIGEVRIRLFPASLRERHYGEAVPPEREEVLHRENIYGSGPPIAEPSAEILQLILDYLSPRGSVVDVGCGAGAYGPGVMAAGHRWLGFEINPVCWEILARRDLAFRKVEEQTGLPCDTGEFDHAVCIEVLEHIADPEDFLREIARIIRRSALFSVPNMEVIPYFKSWEVVPWHLLEADHKNFFTRASLAKLLRKYFARVEVFSYAEHPLRSRDGIPLHAHFFAVAEK